MTDNWRDFPLPDGSYSDDCRPFTQQDVVNYLPTFAEGQGTRSRVKYRTVPGLQHFANVEGPHRGGRDVEGKMFVVAGRHLYQIATDGTPTEIGVIPGTGFVSMTHNQIAGGNQLVIATGDNSYVYNTVTETLTATGVPLVCVDFLNQRILGVDQARRFWRYSGVATATSWEELDNESAESSPDRIVGGIVSQGEWLVFGERTIEVFSNSPTEATAFQRTQVIEKGCASPHTICRLDNSVFFIGNDDVPYRLNGYTPTPIAPKAIIDAISQSSPRRLYAFTWEDRGYAVYYITAQDGQTFGYDVTTQRWHRRESYGLTRWRINTLFKSNGAWYAGDAFNQRLYRLEWGYVYEGCEIMPRKFRTGVLHNDGNRVSVHGFRLTVATGGEPSVPSCPEPPVPVPVVHDLLVTGTAIAPSSDVFATAVASEAPAFENIPSSSGADIAGAIANYGDGYFCAASLSGFRYAPSVNGPWLGGELTPSDYQRNEIVGGDAGWIIKQWGGQAGQTFVGASPPVSFAASSVGPATQTDGSPSSMTIAAGRRAFNAGGFYYVTGERQLIRATNLAGPWTSLYDEPWIAARGWNASGGSIQYFMDGVEFDGKLYVACRWGYLEGSHTMQIRWSPDWGVTWPDEGIVWGSGATGLADGMPYQLAVAGDVLVAYCYSAAAGKIRTSADGFVTLRNLGIGGFGALTNIDQAHMGRKLAVANGLVYVISETQCAVFNPATNAVISTATLPIDLARSISVGVSP